MSGVKYPLQAFVRVCERREDNARRNLAAARQTTREARERVEEAKAAHMACAQARPDKEKTLFNAIKGQVLTQEELDDFHNAVRALLEEELNLARELEKKQQALNKAEAAEEQAHQTWLEASRETAKLAEHRQRWDREARFKAEKAEEAEMERT